MALSRRQVLIAGGVGALIGLPRDAAALEGDLTIGDPSARVQLFEYASLTCPHCARFHADVFPQLKAQYIDTRRIGFTLREIPTTPAPVSVAMFQLARCGGVTPAQYYERVAVLFEQQRAILETGTGEGVLDALLRLGAEWGLYREQILASLNDESAVARIRGFMEEGGRIGVQGTPSFALGDDLIEGGPSLENLSAALDRALTT